MMSNREVLYFDDAFVDIRVSCNEGDFGIS